MVIRSARFELPWRVLRKMADASLQCDGFQISRSVLRSNRQAFAMSIAERDAVADGRRVVRLEAGDHFLLADAEHDHGFGAGRLDHLDRRFEQPDLAAAAPLRIVARDVFRPDAEDDLPARCRRAARRSRRPF